MKPHSAKNKGRKFQQWIRDKIIEVFDLSPDDVQSRSTGAGGEDIMLSSNAKKVFPYAIEAKNVERLNVWKAFEQACMYSMNTNLIPLLFIKKNHRMPLVVLSADFFLSLNREYQELKKDVRIADELIENLEVKLEEYSPNLHRKIIE